MANSEPQKPELTKEAIKETMSTLTGWIETTENAMKELQWKHSTLKSQLAYWEDEYKNAE